MTATAQRDHLVTTDGVRLHVETTGPDDAPVTVLLAHGWTCSTRSWHHQFRDLPLVLGPDAVRVVSYDHRGHGLSEAAPPGTTRIEQLAEDLVQVLDEFVPTGPIVYAGHSMGGMTLLELARTRPDLFGDRIAAAALVSTTSGRTSSQVFGLPARLDAAAAIIGPRMVALAGRSADRRTARHNNTETAVTVRIQRPALRRMVFGRHPDPAEVDILMSDLARLPGRSLNGFFESILEHDREDALEVLGRIPTEIMHGTRDRLLPPRHANRMAQLQPSARLWMYPGAGHMLMQERPRDVTQRIAGLVRKT